MHQLTNIKKLNKHNSKQEIDKRDDFRITSNQNH